MNLTQAAIARLLVCAVCWYLLSNAGAAAQDEGAADQPAAARDDSELLLRTIEELAELKETVQQLRESLERFMDTVAFDLREENRRLRRTVNLRYGEERGGLPAVPMPDRELLEQVLERDVEPLPAVEHPPQKSTYTVVDEFGRTPEAAARLGGNAMSLKGMIVAIPGWAGDDQIIGLGRELRLKYDDYDNINIEVFNDMNTAHQYREMHVGKPGHRVLSISRFKEQGRDTILLMKDGATTEIPLDPDAGPVVLEP
ncbi:MAG: hypothetical protein QGG73_03370 [Candidatus Hydrogenedentes bacterium]|jgi:hypothetical protein|nr:hypothetical protein [Candidatus Hydrogenedentota bacterium]